MAPLELPRNEAAPSGSQLDGSFFAQLLPLPPDSKFRKEMGIAMLALLFVLLLTPANFRHIVNYFSGVQGGGVT